MTSIVNMIESGDMEEKPFQVLLDLITMMVVTPFEHEMDRHIKDQLTQIQELKNFSLLIFKYGGIAMYSD